MLFGDADDVDIGGNGKDNNVDGFVNDFVIDIGDGGGGCGTITDVVSIVMVMMMC